MLEVLSLLWCLVVLAAFVYVLYGYHQRARNKCIPLFHFWTEWGKPVSGFVYVHDDYDDDFVVEELEQQRNCFHCGASEWRRV